MPKTKKKIPTLELCLWIDEAHPNQHFAKRYFVDEIVAAVENHQIKEGWLDTIPSIGFQFQAKDFSWVRIKPTK